MNSSEIRRTFLDFFKKRSHAIVPSAPLIPQGDPTLLFTSAGMVPFKANFLGLKKDLSRAASCQKCFRTTDIDRVGETVRHLTYFEMLGNFSFGDYFKAEAIEWCWEFLTKEMAIDKKRLYPSIYKDDPEAEELWKKHDLANPIVKLGEESNFWTMGPTGPCGPCSEVYYDRGAEFSCGKPTCAVGCDCDRYLEVWNNVFTQFDRQADGSLQPLPRKNIDTGMGLERLALVVQGKRSPFETDLFWPIMERAAEKLNTLPGKDAEHKRVFRVLGDHSRAAAFLTAEGILPSNEGRGYVLRRLIRRAQSHGSKYLSKKEPFVFELASTACELFGGIYPELKKHKKEVERTVRQEEETFLATLEAGESKLQEIILRHPKLVPGDVAFDLYQTYGFPLEVTREKLMLAGISIDEKGFEAASERHRDTSRQGWAGSGETGTAHYAPLLAQVGNSKFIDDKLESEATIKSIEPVGNFVEIVLDQTPFYPEGGGQVGDQGTIEGPGVSLKVINTTKPVQGLIVHHCELVKAQGDKGMKVTARVDRNFRRRSMCHHTATHLLNAALRRVLGANVRQAGSYVGPDRLRFDYTTPRAPTAEELAKVETIVNEVVEHDHKVCTMERDAKDIEKLGATTLVGEDYGSKPRFVWIGPECWDKNKGAFSLELCGGTHVEHTQQVEYFRILRDSSVASGIRRIEAVAGPAALDHFSKVEDRLRSLAKRLQVAPEGLEDKLESILKQEKELRDELGRLKQKMVIGPKGLEDKEERKIGFGGKLVARKVDGLDIKSLRSVVDKLRTEVNSGAVFVASFGDDEKVSFVLHVTDDLIGKGLSAAKAAGELGRVLEGKAGGRPDFAQGGGKAGKPFPEIVDALQKLLQ